MKKLLRRIWASDPTSRVETVGGVSRQIIDTRYRRGIFVAICHGELCPWWCGFLWNDYPRNVVWVTLIGLNIPIRFAYGLWLWALCPWKDSIAFWRNQNKIRDQLRTGP